MTATGTISMIGRENVTRTCFRRQGSIDLKDHQSSAGIRRVRRFVLNGGRLARHSEQNYEFACD
jgi:hypothetical protein